MNFNDIKQKEEKYLMQTYGRFQICLESGKGATAVDVNGKEYIDFTSGIGVNSMGYSNDNWFEAVSQQAAKIQHASNLYYTRPMVELGEKLCKMSGMSRVFFGNSGAEANECAIKLARKYSSDKYGQDRTEIISLVNSFHGRTITTLSATGQDVFHNYFWPFTEGFKYAEANSMDALKAAKTDNTCAVMVELIQGEGGVCPLDREYVKQLREYCDEHCLLLIIDEIQTGIGRTGKMFAFENFDIKPDIITLAKGLGGGLPIGACLCADDLKDTLGIGMHGTTFGGNPVACAGANAVLNDIADDDFLAEVRAKGEYICENLKAIPEVEEVRGMGMMIGIVLKNKKAADVAKQCVENGLMVLTAKTLVRLLPPLNITYEEIDKGLAVLTRVLNA